MTCTDTHSGNRVSVLIRTLQGTGTVARDILLHKLPKYGRDCCMKMTSCHLEPIWNPFVRSNLGLQNVCYFANLSRYFARLGPMASCHDLPCRSCRKCHDLHQALMAGMEIRIDSVEGHEPYVFICFSHAPPHTPVQRVQSQKEASN